MSEAPDSIEKSSEYSATTIEKVFELLDNKLVTFGIPGALSAVGINKIVANAPWTEAAWCFAGAAGVWIAIKIGKRLAPELDQALDWGIGEVKRSLSAGWSAIRSDFEGKFLKRQADLCGEFISEGFNPDRTAIPLLEEVFVPLDLSGAVNSGVWMLDRVAKTPEQKLLKAIAEYESASNLQIWDLLARSRHERPFRQMSILAKGGMGKTTLLRHVALIYAQHKYRSHNAPKLVPVLLRLRDWRDALTQTQPPNLPQLIGEFYLPSLFKDQPLTVPADWAKKLLESRSALVMLDGFDEVPEDKRQQVSHWISAQMQQYREAVFIVTSRPAGFKDYEAQKPAIPIFVNKFSPAQQEKFIRRWYLCQERCCRSARQIRQAREVAKARSDQLITQLRQRAELAYMAENPLLLNMLTTYHRFDPSRELPKQRIDLYRGICKLQLDDRPRARFIQMLLPFEKSQAVLQNVALAMVKADQFKLERQSLLKFLEQQPIWQQEEVEAASWLKQMVEVSELLVEREPGEYEFPHLSFQGFFAATRLAGLQTSGAFKASARLVLQNWNKAVWRETVLLYTAQLSPSRLNQVIRKACELDSEAAALAAICLEEYPRSEEVKNELKGLLQSLKYRQLEEYLKAQKWREADEETYRLIITTIGKEEGQEFNHVDFKDFPYEELQKLDELWVNHSKGKWGFSVQERIWKECDSPREYNADLENFGDRVGWYREGRWLKYDDLTFNLANSSVGELPHRASRYHAIRQRYHAIRQRGYFSKLENLLKDIGKPPEPPTQKPAEKKLLEWYEYDDLFPRKKL